MNEILRPSVNRQPLKRGVEQAVLPETRERLIKTLGDVVAFRTVSAKREENQDQFRGLFDYVGRRVRDVSSQTGREFTIREYESNGFLSTIITPKDDSRPDDLAILNPKIAMLIHADVVGAEDESLFTMHQDRDNLYGRGVYDMKQGLAIGLDLLQELPTGAALVITSDEEIGGENGAEFLAKKVGLNPEFLIVLDGQKSEHLCFGAKGIWHYKVSFNSLLNFGGHGARYEDYSASELAIDLRNSLRTYYPWRYDNSPAGTTFNIGVIKGGDTTNRVAQNATLQIDMRFSNESEREKSRLNVQQSLEKIAAERLHEVYGDNLPVRLQSEVGNDGAYQLYIVSGNGEKYLLSSIENLIEIPVYNINDQDRRVQRFRQIVEEITKEPVKLNDADTGGNDGTNWPNVPAILYMPKGGLAHMNGEWLSATSLLETREAIAQLMHEELT